ncbi:MAG: hypothetical protein Q9190_007060 [Brigantiaea leucoxantha]
MTSRTDAAEDRSETGSVNLENYPDSIDIATFEQILEMDEDDAGTNGEPFSKGIVYGFFEQAEATFIKMDAAAAERNLDELSSLGHFLKGSSATIGLTKVKDSCEKIQHYGARKDASGNTRIQNDQLCLDKINETLKTVKAEYAEAEKLLRRYYHDSS